MSSVNHITGAVAVALVFTTSPGALNAQVTSGQDTSRAPWTVDRGRETFPSRTGADTAVVAGVATDTAFIREAVRANVLEVELGRLAQSRAEDDDVEEFAERMVSEHGVASRQWAALARSNRVTADTVANPAGKLTAERLERLSGDDFDRAYMTEMIRRHEQDLAAFERAATAARSPTVRQLAAGGATTIREHLALARQVARDVGVSSVAAASGDTVRRPSWVPAPSTRDDRAQDDRDGSTRLREADRAFITNVLQDHLMHVRLAERAGREGRSAETRRFAQRMEADFTRWQERWAALAERHDLKAPKGLGPLHGQKVKRLERASSKEVDRTYAAIVADHLASVVPYFQKEGQAVRPAAARRLVDEELPLIREHLARARRLQGQASAQAERSARE